MISLKLCLCYDPDRVMMLCYVSVMMLCYDPDKERSDWECPNMHRVRVHGIIMKLCLFFIKEYQRLLLLIIFFNYSIEVSFSIIIPANSKFYHISALNYIGNGKSPEIYEFYFKVMISAMFNPSHLTISLPSHFCSLYLHMP